jgi:hypothetical protein
MSLQIVRHVESCIVVVLRSCQMISPGSGDALTHGIQNVNVEDHVGLSVWRIMSSEGT